MGDRTYLFEQAMYDEIVGDSAILKGRHGECSACGCISYHVNSATPDYKHLNLTCEKCQKPRRLSEAASWRLASQHFEGLHDGPGLDDCGFNG